MRNKEMSIKEAFDSYMEEVEMSYSENTVKAYRNGIRLFLESIERLGITQESPASSLNQSCFDAFLKYAKNYSPRTESLYLTAVKGFFSFLSENGVIEYNPAKLKKFLKNKARQPDKRTPTFSVETIEKVIEYAEQMPNMECETTREELILKRNAAFIITLADTGMRVGEICNLYVRDIDQYQRKATVTGASGNPETVRLSERTITYINLYLNRRTEIMGRGGRVYAALPVFAAHDKSTGHKLTAITPKTGREIVKECVAAAVGPGMAGSVTPSSFRHYFISKVLEKTGDMELTREITRTASPVIIRSYSKYDSKAADEKYSKLFD